MTPPLLSDADLSVNNEISDNEITIERCPHDAENPYAQISRALIRDASISPECRWLIIYFLSMKSDWKINIAQLINHLKPHMGRDKVYALIKEAIESGYMKRVEITKGGRAKISFQFKYYVSETPKFKKCFRNTDFQDTVLQDTVNPHIKNKNTAKKEHIKETPPTSSDLEPLEQSASQGSANADGREFASSKLRKGKKESDFTKEVQDLTSQMLETIKIHESEFIIPSNKLPFMTQVGLMLNTDKRCPDKILEYLNWALNDDFWSGVVLKKNPAKALRDNFLTFKSKMKSPSFSSSKAKPYVAEPETVLEPDPILAKILKERKEKSKREAEERERKRQEEELKEKEDWCDYEG